MTPLALRFYRKWTLVVIAALLMAGCRTPAGVSTSSGPASSLPPSTATAPAAAPAAAGKKLVIYAPATPSSIPVLLAARRMAMSATGGESIDVKIFTDQSQASTLFLRGDVTLLVTGLAVGVQFFKNGAP